MQEIIVYIIGVVVALYIGASVYRFFTRRKDPCRGCPGCSAKDIYDAKRMTCKPKKENTDCGCGCS